MSVSGTGPGPRGTDVLTALREGRIEGADNRLRAATRLLQGSFYEELFKAMRGTVPDGGVISGSQGQDIFESLLDQRVAEVASMKAEGGLGDALYRYFTGSDAAAAVGVTPDDATAAGFSERADPTGQP